MSRVRVWHRNRLKRVGLLLNRSKNPRLLSSLDGEAVLTLLLLIMLLVDGSREQEENLSRRGRKDYTIRPT